MQGSSTRPPVTTERVVEVSRALLVSGGPEAVVIREVARRLQVTAPALYKHVRGRDDLLTLLIAACQDELTQACEQARDAAGPDDPEARLRSATWAFRSWALANRAEFGLLYGTPIAGYSAPEGGPTVATSQRFGAVFAGIYVELLEAGRMRAVERDELGPRLVADLEAYLTSTGLPLEVGQAYLFALGWQRMLGVVSVEVAGHLDWVFADPEPFVRRQLDDLADELLRPLTS